MIPVYQEYKKLTQKIQETQELLLDPEIKELASLELENLRASQEETTTRLQNLLRVEDPLNTKNAIIEIQAGVGGDESALFVEILFGMYARYAKKQGWVVEITDVSHGNQGGFKNISLMIEGSGAYGAFRYESGSHKIQRVSPTDTAKRVHTSAATVVALPEIQPLDIKINELDVRVDKMNSGGPGGQAVNKVETAIRLTHEPTGIMVRCEGRSQHANLERAWKILTSRIAEHFYALEEEKQIKNRRKLRGDGSRGGCIRTYNFPQDRITDHRSEVTFHNLDKLLAGNIEPLLESLQLLEAEGQLPRTKVRGLLIEL